MKQQIMQQLLNLLNNDCFVLVNHNIIPEPFLSTLQNVGVKFLQGVENFQQGEVLFVQAAYNFWHAAKMHFMQL